MPINAAQLRQALRVRPAPVVRRFVSWNRQVASWEHDLVARVLPGIGPSGPVDFATRILPSLLQRGMRVLDVGGGKRPAIPCPLKRQLGLTVVGLDILPDDLALAPAGAYDTTICGDVATVEIPGPYDLVFSRAVLEHVDDPKRALANLAQALTPGGLMAHYLPCRNAPFAVINRLLGNARAKRLLLAIYPEKEEHSGFLAHYRDCTPSRMRALCRSAGVEDVTLTPYYHSRYAAFFVPFYTAELLRQALSCACGWDWWSEGFAIVARRPAPQDDALPTFPPDSRHYPY